MSDPCPRFPSKIQHPTREDALDQQKRLVFKNAAAGQPERSHGLHVYPCADCGAWHVGHVESLPLVWHYTSCEKLDAILESGALEPANPRAYVSARQLHEDEIQEWAKGSLVMAAIPLSRSFQQRYRNGLPRMVDVPIPGSGRRVRVPHNHVERERLLWFSRNDEWEHSVDDPTREILEVIGEGLLRFGVPPSFAKLRWSDYLQRNATPPVLRNYFARRSDPTEWLATDEPVPLEQVRRTELYFQGAWISIHDLDAAAFEEYLAGREEAYNAARASLGVKLDAFGEVLKTGGGPGGSGTAHDNQRRFFTWVATTLHMNEAERIVYEDTFFMMPEFQAESEHIGRWARIRAELERG